MPRVLQSAVNTLLTQTTIEDGLHYGYVFIQVFSDLTCPLNALRKCVIFNREKLRQVFPERSPEICIDTILRVIPRESY